MALGTVELFDSASQDPLPRIMPDEDGTMVVTFDNASGGPTLAVGTPVVNLGNGLWRAWADGDETSKPVAGFVYPQAVVLDATNDVQGVILTRGIIHYGDIVLPTGQTQATLDGALKSGPREMGLIVQGLPGAGDHFVDPDT